jgi:tetratricopeptide (TPR) repeat protein
MNKAILISTAIASLALAACSNGELAVRAVGKSQLAEQAPASVRVAEGNAQLALGNVGLAIESFRKAVRDDPASIDGYVGLAACYERMGRHDLAAMQVESAMALQPDSLALLERLALNLDAEGRTDKANAVRREMAMRMALATDATPSATDVARAVAIDERLAVSGTAPPALATPTSDKPRLVRLSHGEIALVTGPGALWEKAVAAPARSVRSHHVEILNAARINRLAARTRLIAVGKGWSNVSVGDAGAVRSDSVVLYPLAARLTAARLAAQFGFRAEHDPNRKHITVLLGQDAARLVAKGA